MGQLNLRATRNSAGTSLFLLIRNLKGNLLHAACTRWTSRRRFQVIWLKCFRLQKKPLKKAALAWKKHRHLLLNTSISYIIAGFMLGWIKNYAKVSIEEPHLGRAFFFFLLPFILTLVVAVFIGISVNVMAVGYNIFLALVAWFLSAAVLFVVVHLFKGHEATGKFKGVFVGLAFRYFFWF